MIHSIFDMEINNWKSLLAFQRYKISDLMDCITGFYLISEDDDGAFG